MRAARWFVNCSVVDVEQGALIDDAAIAIADDGTVAWVGERPARDADQPAGEVKDLSGGVVMPGLVDAHVHLFRTSGADPRGVYLAATDDERRATGRRNAHEALAAGVTTVRDLGGPADLLAELAEVTRRDETGGPTIVWAGAPITRPGGDDHYFGGEATDVVAAQQIVDRQVASGAGVVVMVVSGGGLTPGTSPARVELDRDVMEAVCARSASLGVPVVARCHATAGMVACVEMGVATIEHASFLDADGAVRFDAAVAARLVDAGVSVGPTLFAAQQALARYRRSGVVNPDDAYALSRLEARTDNFRRWLASGVTIAAGSASGYLGVPASALVDEAIAYAEAGMTTAAVLRAITHGNAALIGRADIGRIDVGARADLVVYPASPLDDITLLRRPALVVRGGRPVTP